VVGVSDFLDTVFSIANGITNIHPWAGGLIFAIVLGLPTAYSVIWTLRDIKNPPAKDENKWDADWDLD
jgi:hypothetical protein